MVDHFINIYRNHADDYDLLVSREDYQGNLLTTLSEIHPLQGADVVEFGAGTGRVSRLLAPHINQLYAFDFMPSMLTVARETLMAQGDNWALSAGDNGQMPVKSGVADIALQGWSFGHATGWHPASWRGVIDGYIREMMRVLKNDGTAIMIETMGTGVETATPPNDDLAEYYAHLTHNHGFQYRWIRTDYKFADIEEAERLNRFFFGDELGDRVKQENWVIMPECTGVWWKSKSSGAN